MAAFKSYFFIFLGRKGGVVVMVINKALKVCLSHHQHFALGVLALHLQLIEFKKK